MLKFTANFTAQPRIRGRHLTKNLPICAPHPQNPAVPRAGIMADAYWREYDAVIGDEFKLRDAQILVTNLKIGSLRMR